MSCLTRLTHTAPRWLLVASAAALRPPTSLPGRHSLRLTALCTRPHARHVTTMQASGNKKTKAHTAIDEIDETGAFARTAAAWCGRIEEGGRYAPEAGRYHLYVSLACPWAAGVLTALHLKGLEGVISHSVVHPTWARTRPDDPNDEHCGWQFRAQGDAPVANSLGHGSFECDAALIPDTVNGFKTLRDLYESAGDTAGKYSTPVLWCKKEQTIVSNESMDILKILNSAFNALAVHPDVDLFPEAHRDATAALNEIIYNHVNNGVYRCGFARTQEAYDEAVKTLFAALNDLDKRLVRVCVCVCARACACSFRCTHPCHAPILTRHLHAILQTGSRFLMGDDFTWLDLRLYHTLVRFDCVYHTYFKTNERRIADYPGLLRFIREVA